MGIKLQTDQLQHCFMSPTIWLNIIQYTFYWLAALLTNCLVLHSVKHNTNIYQ